MSWLPDWVTGFDRENYEAGLEADRKNAAITEDLRRRQLISEDDARTAQLHYAQSAAYDPDAAINEAFLEGLDDGADNIRGAVGGTIDTVLGTLLKTIPWQLWLIGLVVAAWKLGLLDGVFKGFVKRGR